MMTIPKEAEFKAKYDLFFVKFFDLYEKHIRKSKKKVSSSSDFDWAMKDLWYAGWRSLLNTFPRDRYGGYAMLSDRGVYLVKINVYLLPRKDNRGDTGEYELEFLIAPTYLPAPKQKLIYNKVIPALQAQGFKVKPG